MGTPSGPLMLRYGRFAVVGLLGIAVLGNLAGCGGADPTSNLLGQSTPRPTSQPAAAATEPETPAEAPSPTAKAVVAAVAVVSTEPQSLAAGEAVAFRGKVGTYRWTALSFPAAQVVVRWDAKANPGACKVAWTLDPDAGKTIKRTVRVARKDREKGVERYGTNFNSGALAVSSTCKTWLLTFEGNDPPPAVVGGGGSGGGSGGGGDGGNCHPSYSPCLPIVDDLDCPDVRAMGKAPVTVKGPDEYRLDRDGDGIGCE